MTQTTTPSTTETNTVCNIEKRLDAVKKIQADLDHAIRLQRQILEDTKLKFHRG